MKIKDLGPFCSGREGKMNVPWSKDGFTYATDGFVVVRVPRLEDVPEIANPVNTVNIYSKYPEPPPEAFIPLPEAFIPLPASEPCPKCHGKIPEECPECDGGGEFDLETDFNTYTVECKSCSGEGGGCSACNSTGHIDPKPLIEIGGKVFTKAYIRCFTKFENPKIAVNPLPNSVSWIKFDGGDGLVMATTVSRCE